MKKSELNVQLPILKYTYKSKKDDSFCSVLKVGVACVDDGKRLLKDYGLIVRGCVDLRNLVVRNRIYQHAAR